MHYSIGHAGEWLGMGDHHGPLLGDHLQQRVDALSSLRVQIPGGLVHQDHPWMVIA